MYRETQTPLPWQSLTRSNDFGGGLELDDLGGLDLWFNDLEFDTDWIKDCLDFSQEEPFSDPSAIRRVKGGGW